MNIAAIRNSALSSIDEKNNLPTWKGGAWPGDSSFSNSGVSGLGVSGQYLQGLINLISNGNISLIQNGQQITISGSNQNSQIIGSYVSGLGIANNLLTGAVILSGLGSISLSQNNQIIYISGGNSQISDYFGVTGIRISGDSISGAISFTQAGNVYLIQNGNNIIISGSTSAQGGGTVITSTGDGIYISLGNTGGQVLNSGVFNAINWNSGIRSGILTFNQSEPSKIYIQTGCSGYYSISAYVNLNNNDLFDNYVWKKNGNSYLTNKSSNIANTYLNDGDYLEYYINPVNSTSISGNINCDIVNTLVEGNGGSNLPSSGTGYLYNDGNGNLSWDNIEPPLISTWINRVNQAGGSLGTNSIRYAKSLISTLSGINILPKLPLVIPLLGNDINAAIQPLINKCNCNPINAGFINSDFSEISGLNGGYGKLVHLQIRPTDIAIWNRGGLGYWELNIPSAIDCEVFGGYRSSEDNRFQIFLRTSTPRQLFWWGSPSNANAGSTVEAAGNNHYLGQRTGSSPGSCSLYKNGIIVGSSSTSADSAPGADIVKLTLMGATFTDTQTVSTYHSGRCGIAYLSDGTLTTGEIYSLHTGISGWMHYIGRI